MLLQPLLGMVKHNVRRIKSRNNRTNTGTQRQRREPPRTAPQRSLSAASPPRATLQQNHITKRLRYQLRGKPSIIPPRARKAPLLRRSGRLAPRLHRKPEGPVLSAARPARCAARPGRAPPLRSDLSPPSGRRISPLSHSRGLFSPPFARRSVSALRSLPESKTSHRSLPLPSAPPAPWPRTPP